MHTGDTVFCSYPGDDSPTFRAVVLAEPQGGWVKVRLTAALIPRQWKMVGSEVEWKESGLTPTNDRVERGQRVRIIGRPFDVYVVVHPENGRGNIDLMSTLGGWRHSAKRHEIFEVLPGTVDVPADVLAEYPNWND